MSQQKEKRKNEADMRIAEIRTTIEKLLKRTRQIEVELARKERKLIN